MTANGGIGKMIFGIDEIQGYRRRKSGTYARGLMEELIRKLTGKKVDVSCGPGAMLRGEVIEVREGVLYLRDEDEKSAYVAIDKIATVYECSDSVSRPGFIG